MRRHRPTAPHPRRARVPSRVTKRCDKIHPNRRRRQTRSPRSKRDAFGNPNPDFESLKRARISHPRVRGKRVASVRAMNKRLDAPRRGAQRADLTLRQLYRSIVRLSAHAEQALDHAIDVQRRRHDGDAPRAASFAAARKARIERVGTRLDVVERAIDRSVGRSSVSFRGLTHRPFVGVCRRRRRRRRRRRARVRSRALGTRARLRNSRFEPALALTHLFIRCCISCLFIIAP